MESWGFGRVSLPHNSPASSALACCREKNREDMLWLDRIIRERGQKAEGGSLARRPCQFVT